MISLPAPLVWLVSVHTSRDSQHPVIFLCTEARDGAIDVESLVDNFINFHSGGRMMLLAGCVFTYKLWMVACGCIAIITF